uniref:Uncharacterized protein n=1 Tax=Oryza rufipogon TaxID=4529 RepID=A0A0E0QMV2_ORYRU
MSSSSEDAVSSLGTGKEDEKEGRVGGAIEARVVGKDSSKDGGRRGQRKTRDKNDRGRSPSSSATAE